MWDPAVGCAPEGLDQVDRSNKMAAPSRARQLRIVTLFTYSRSAPVTLGLPGIARHFGTAFLEFNGILEEANTVACLHVFNTVACLSPMTSYEKANTTSTASSSTHSFRTHDFQPLNPEL